MATTDQRPWSFEAGPPTWAEFTDQPAVELGLRPPAQELAEVLRRLRADLDEAGRAGARSRAVALHVLGEQAALAIELEELLERHGLELDDAPPAHARDRLERLKDRMLAHLASCGLEVLRLRSRGAGDAAPADGWNRAATHVSPSNVAEVLAAAAGVGDQPSAQRPTGRAAAPRIVCPIAGCGAENPPAADVCIGCLTPMAGFGRLSMHPAALFNRGLRAARNGDGGRAREYFAAVVLWHPDDLTTRNAHALACLDAGDLRAARVAWEDVLDRAPGDGLAVRGLAAVSARSAARRGG
ncbi:MAG: hypothetical protein LC685_00675 [Actinobacteria bacterium]|nr:hypothetical protein [Actinomycetota bacterium]